MLWRKKLKPIYINQLALANGDFIYTFDKVNFYKRKFINNTFQDEKINLEYDDFIYFECLPVSELVATYGVPNLCFIGHTDTVKCSSNWKTNPFELKITDNKMYGLGVCDMKGGIAAFLDTLKNINLDELKKEFKLLLHLMKK